MNVRREPSICTRKLSLTCSDLAGCSEPEPHRLDRYMARTIRIFEQKARTSLDCISPSAGRRLSYCGENRYLTAGQTRSGTDAFRQVQQGGMGFEYYRHGILSLYAALNVKTAERRARPPPRHTSAEFVECLTEIVARTRWAKQDSHCLRQLVGTQNDSSVGVLDVNPYPPLSISLQPYSSWLYQVELWLPNLA